MLRAEEIRKEIGRCTGGTFLRLVHIPTSISGVKAPLRDETLSKARLRLLEEVDAELTAQGLTRWIIPATVLPTNDHGPETGLSDADSHDS
jgi:hypothetical protein